MIRFEGFSFQYKDEKKSQLRDFTAKFTPGDLTLVYGGSAAGKTTLFRCLNGFVPNYYEGSYDGRFTINKIPAFYSTAFDKANLIASYSEDLVDHFIGLTVAEELSFILDKVTLRNRDLRSIVSQTAKEWGLEHRLNDFPELLSDGEKAKLKLAKLFLSNREVYLLERPFQFLDEASRQLLINKIISEQKREKIIIIFDHDLTSTRFLDYTNLIHLKYGRMVFNGDVEQFLVQSIDQQDELVHLKFLKEIGLNFSEEDQVSKLEKMTLSQLKFQVYDNHFKEPVERDDLLYLKDFRVDQIGRKLTVNNVNLRLFKGETVALVGEIGSGKSSLAKGLSGQLKSRGQIQLEGQSLRDVSGKEWTSAIVYPHIDQLVTYHQYRVSRYLTQLLEARGVDKSVLRETLEDCLGQFHLTDLRHRLISDLSLTERYRLLLAAVDYHAVQVLILDDYLIEQDAFFKKQFHHFLSVLQKKGMAILYLTNQSQRIIQKANRVISLRESKILCKLDIASFFNHDLVVAASGVDPLALKYLADKLAVSLEDVLEFYQLKQGGV